MSPRAHARPVEPKLAIALTALNIGLAVQHLVDPEEVPLSLYPALFELPFVPIATADQTWPDTPGFG